MFFEYLIYCFGRPAITNRKSHGIRFGKYEYRITSDELESTIIRGTCFKIDGDESGVTWVVAISPAFPDEALLAGPFGSIIVTSQFFLIKCKAVHIPTIPQPTTHI